MEIIDVSKHWSFNHSQKNINFELNKGRNYWSSKRSWQEITLVNSCSE